ncbi:MAG TPA: DUF3226 domain-containing protein [Ktedonobacteraceae bacterium]|nr:DUF3226 domain-containing protein [Ktedonobacteraceae bacterium]
MNNDVIKEDKLNYVLVEGPDDAQVFYHLLRYYGLDTHITIQQKAGIDTLLEALEVELKRRAETRLGIVVDADTDIANRWQSLRDRLIEAGYSAVPLRPAPGGTILKQEGRPMVGLWLMPDNTISGRLEDFMSLLIPAGDILWPMAQDSVQQVIIKDRRFPQTQAMKANMHTWLAWQEEPGKPMGQAITKRYLDAAAPHAQQLVEWIRRLFDLKSA